MYPGHLRWMLCEDERLIAILEQWVDELFCFHHWPKLGDKSGRYFFLDWATIFYFDLYIKDTYHMKEKSNVKRNRASSSSDNQSPVRWLNAVLSDDDKAAIDGDTHTDSEVALDALGLLTIGCSITIKERREENCYMSVFLADDPHTAGGLVGISAYAPTVPGSLRVLLYKWYVLLAESIPSPTSSGSAGYR